MEIRRDHTKETFPCEVLVTGGAGFVGHHLSQALLNKGCRVRILDDLSTGRREQIPAKTEFIEGDIRDFKTVTRAVQGCDIVFHLAARVELQKSIVDPADCYSVNIDGTAQIVRAALQQKVRRLVFASSCAVYPLHPQSPLTEAMSTRGETPYALSKLAGEQTLEIYHRLEGLSACSLRCFNIYGPGQRPDSPYAAVIPKFIDRALRGDPLTINGAGLQTRDFIHVQDIVSGYLLAAASEIHGAFNLGTGTSTSILRLATVIAGFDGRSAISHLPALSGDASSSQADISSISKVLNFTPQMCLDEGLRELYIKTRDHLKGANQGELK